ncbi:MAG: winged helix-turn-helix transcriptional regulator [Polyangiaceae bacterium]|nr:winged helix-turn-helix transcriptional regulator [Polyangiaceae bacterium]MCW5789745.1 winged helix-turn-helix transcriptional regulator [Polyangiaceae bacterium]
MPNPHPPSPSKVHGPDVEVDLERRRVRCRGESIELTPSEFGVLVALWERPGVVLTRAQLMQRGAEADGQVTERAIDTHVRRIRGKFRPFGVDPIGTVHGVGYRASEG